jgi:predicted amidohydrolase YtcJ
MRILPLIISVLCFAAGCTPGDTADLVLMNGRIVTMDEQLPEARAVAIKDNTILAVGSNEEIHGFIGRRTNVIDLDARLAVPGFIEGHGHFLGIGNAMMQLNLTDVTSWSEIVAMVADAARRAETGELIQGRGWHQEKWDETPSPNVQGLPVHHSLSEVSPDNPVILTHASGHMSFANAKAMELAGITRQTANPRGGQILRDAGRNPTGAFRQTAQGLLAPVMELWDPDINEQIDLATEEVISKGVTSFQDAGSSFDAIDVFRKRAEEGTLGVRLWVMIREPNERLAARLADYHITDGTNDYLTVRAIKRAIDGALGTHGAWLLQPYADIRTTSGFNTTPLDYLEETARLAIEHGFQLCVHAIGDRGNRETLNIFENVFARHPDKTDLRWRIEHAQHLHPDDVPRFGDLGVIASMQGVHCTSDGPWVGQRIGQRRAREGAYAWRALLDTGATIVNGTDAPVEDVDPVNSFFASVTRRMDDGSFFFPEQRMTREEALRSYTIDAAYAAFEEDHKGSITPGKRADIVVLSKDIMDIPDEAILDTEVLYTILDGKVVFERYRER